MASAYVQIKKWGACRLIPGEAGGMESEGFLGTETWPGERQRACGEKV